MSIEVIILIGIVTFFSGVMVAKIKIQQRLNKTYWSRAQDLYEFAHTLFEKNDFTMALVCLSEAKAFYSSHEIYNLLALTLEKLNRHSEAAAYYDTIISPNFQNKPKDSSFYTYYYYRSAWAYRKSGNWEFAYIRSDDAVSSIQSKLFPRYVDNIDYEDDLRAMRMVSCLHHFHGTNAFEQARPDVDWIIANLNSNFRDLALSLKNVGNVIPDMANILDRMMMEPIIDKINRN